jgi:hypothetical protein
VWYEVVVDHASAGGRRRAPQPHEGLGRVGNGLWSPPSQRGSWLPRGRAYSVYIISLAQEERRSGGRCVLRVYSVYCRACLPLYAALSREYLVTAGGLAARGLLDCPVRLGRAMAHRGTRRYMYHVQQHRGDYQQGGSSARPVLPPARYY